jgi:hypothetical protein
VNYSAYLRGEAVQPQVGVEIRGWPHLAIDHFAIQIEDGQILRAHALVGHPARFDGDQAAGAVNPAGVSEGKQGQPPAGQFQIGLEDLFTQRL